MISSFNDIKRLAERGNVVPVFKRIPADLDTPVSTYLRLASRKKRAFLLESIEGGETLARYSFVGFDPFMRISVERATKPGKQRRITVIQGRARKTVDAEPLQLISQTLAEFRPVTMEGIPRFSGGAVGYFAYDSFRWFEDVPDENPDPLRAPDCILDFYQSLVVFDHLRQEIALIANLLTEHGAGSLRAKYNAARDWIDETERQLQKPVRRSKITGVANRKPKLQPLTERKDFEARVRKIKRHIKEGDIFQAVLSQRWKAKVRHTPLELYRRLRRINPSPYMYLLRFDDTSVIGSSPEMLARVEQGTIETCPIAGTRPRGHDSAADEKMAAELLADPKERAEHIMLLDLGRNDIGRVSEPGSVEVMRNMEIEKYSHVIHLVSTVAGKLRAGTSALEGMFSCFPAGTVSGAPKIRAMEIIDELEDCRRGPYAGAIAYLDFWGNLDSCIAIRTMIQQGEDVYLQAGAGIVADSKPKKEFEETEHKVRVLYQALVS